MKILDFSGDNTGTLNFVVKLKDVEDGDQTFISKNRYIDKNTEPKLSHNDSHFFIHDTLLSHEDSDKPQVRHQSLESIKWQLYYMDKYYPNAKLIVHYTPGLYEIYKDNPKILFENDESYPQSINAKNLCLDTAHMWLSGVHDLNKIYQTAKKAKLIHFNGLKADSKQHARPGSKSDIMFTDKKELQKFIELSQPKIGEW